MDGMPLTDQLARDLAEVLAKYGDQGLTLFEILGCLEDLKLDVWVKHQHEKYRNGQNGGESNHG